MHRARVGERVVVVRIVAAGVGAHRRHVQGAHARPLPAVAAIRTVVAAPCAVVLVRVGVSANRKIGAMTDGLHVGARGRAVIEVAVGVRNQRRPRSKEPVLADSVVCVGAGVVAPPRRETIVLTEIENRQATFVALIGHGGDRTARNAAAPKSNVVAARVLQVTGKLCVCVVVVLHAVRIDVGFPVYGKRQWHALIFVVGSDRPRGQRLRLLCDALIDAHPMPPVAHWISQHREHADLNVRSLAVLPACHVERRVSKHPVKVPNVSRPSRSHLSRTRLLCAVEPPGQGFARLLLSVLAVLAGSGDLLTRLVAADS